MKIGIVTFHDAANYGAVLQAYGLHTVLAKLGHESEFIRFAKEQVVVKKTPAQIALNRKYPRLEQKKMRCWLTNRCGMRIFKNL